MTTVATPAPMATTTVRRPRGLSPHRMLQIFMVIVLAHWVEHVLQAFQIYMLGWKVPDARGALGLLWPWLITSEAMHYAYAIAMLGGLIYLRPLFDGSARQWWMLALVLQIWHHFEHLLLLGQAIFGHPLFGAAKPTSIVQLVIPRVELHLFYNAVVFGPMMVAIVLWSRGRRSNEGELNVEMSNRAA
jgi:hypothetical protein